MVNNKILIISNTLCYPTHKNGVSNTLFHLLDEMADDFTVDYYYLDKKDSLNEALLKSKLKTFINIFNVDIRGTQIFTKLNNKLILKPRNSWKTDIRKFKRINCDQYSYIVFSDLIVGLLADKLYNTTNSKIIFFEADSTSLFYKRSQNLSKNFVQKFYYFSQYCNISKIENYLYDISFKIIFVSSVDKEFTLKKFNKIFPLKFENINIGVDMVSNIKSSYLIKDKLILGFSGILDYRPNKLAVDYIIEKVLPQIEKLNLNFEMHIIGKNPSKEWEKSVYFSNKSLIITGFVDNISSYILNLDIYLSPLFLGTGMKNKILNAMALGLPIICSTTSAEGIKDLKDGQNIFIVDENESLWANKILTLHNSPGLMSTFGLRCMEIIKYNYSWNNFYKSFFKDFHYDKR